MNWFGNKFGYDNIKFHREGLGADKGCPGTSINYDSILVVLLLIIGLLFIYKKGKKEFIRQVILSLVVKAEKSIGSGTGRLKYAMVVEKVYK